MEEMKEEYIIKGVYYKRCSGNSLTYTGKKAHEYTNDMYKNDKKKAYELLEELKDNNCNPYRIYRDLKIEVIKVK